MVADVRNRASASNYCTNYDDKAHDSIRLLVWLKSGRLVKKGARGIRNLQCDTAGSGQRLALLAPNLTISDLIY